MFDGLFIASIIGSCIEVIKEKLEPTIPAENWANMELYNEDIAKGITIEQRIKNLKKGKYRLTKEQMKEYSEPHRDPKSGKIIIENCLLYEKDLREYGAYQTYKWVEQGKYNLSPEELEKECKRIEEGFEYLYSL